MNVIYFLMDFAAKLPDLLSFIICPALLIVGGLLFAIFGLRRAYWPYAVALGGVGVFLISAKALDGCFAYLGLYTVLVVLVSLFFLIPFRRGKRGEEEDLFTTFYKPLDLGEEGEPLADETLDKEECDLRLTHTLELLEKLKKSDLSASDRLEADALSNTLDGLADKELTPAQMRSLNDCLATILKLTAKYKL